LFRVFEFLRRNFFEERGFEDGRRGRVGFSGGTRGIASRRSATGSPPRLGIFAGNDDTGGRVDPFARIVHAGDGADAANDAAGRDGGFVDSFDHAFESKTKIEAAPPEKAGGVGVTVDR